MARKKGSELIKGIKPVSLKKKFVQPVDITDDFTSFVCFKHVELDKIEGAGTKERSVKEIERAPLMLLTNGKKFEWFYCKENQVFDFDDESYIIDRNIDDKPTLPHEKFIGGLMVGEHGQRIIKSFDAKELFDEVLAYLERYFYLEKPYLYKIITLFVINCWVFDAHESTPYLFIRSPVMGCGKTHLGESICWMCNGRMFSPNAKAHHVFRAVHSTKTILAFDEIKKWTDRAYKMSDEVKDIISLVNAGFQKGGSKVDRIMNAGTTEEKVVLYDSYAPKIMITTTGSLPGDTASRCIELIIQRAPPKGIDYGERWYEPERKARLKKIREMGFLFRMKYGREIFDISRNPHWRDELDIAKTFDGIRNRELEIFRPLVILTLKFKPEWKELVDIYVRKYIEMRNKLQPTPINNILWAMRSLYNEVVNSNWDAIQDDEYGEVSIEQDEIHGAVFLVPVKAIEVTVEKQTSLNLFGKHASSAIGKYLNELGFITGKKRTRMGVVRIVKVSQLEDMIERYLGMGLVDDEGEGVLDQAQRVDLIREIMTEKKYAKEGILYDELLEEIDSRMTEEQMRSALKHLRGIGHIAQIGKAYQWVA